MASAEKLPSGRYRGVYRDASGKRRTVKGTFPGKRAAVNAAIEAQAESRKKDWRSPDARKRTWGEWVDEWWTTRDIEDSTAQRQLTQRVKHMDPQWGGVPLEDITRQDVRAWAVSLMKERGLARGSVQKLTLMLSASFNAAIDARIVDYNPAARLGLGEVKSTHMRFLSSDEAIALRDAMTDDVDRAIMSTLLGAGLRWGEVNGLQVGRVSLSRREIIVADVWDSVGRRLKEYPKDRRQRPVPITDALAERLEPIIAGRTTGFVFEKNGYRLDYANWRKKSWLPAVGLSGVGQMRLHDCRHTYASFLAAAGFSLLEIGQLLGHEDPSTTQIYAHLVNANAERVRAALPAV